jgi:hypothetical protein
MVSSLRLGSRLSIAPALVLVLMFLVCGTLYQVVAHQGEALGTVVQQRAAQTRSAAELAANARQAHAEVYQLITWIGASFSQSRTDTLVRGIYRRHAAVARSFTALARQTSGVKAEGNLVQQTEIAYRAYLASVRDVIDLARSDQSISANAMTRSERAFDTVLLRLDALTRIEQLHGERAAARAADDCNTIAILLPVALMVALALMVGVTLAVRRTLEEEITAMLSAETTRTPGPLRRGRPRLRLVASRN